MEPAAFEALETRTLFNAPGWSDTIDNPFFLLAPGMTWVYKGTSNGESAKQRAVVQNYTKVIRGVTCHVLLDRAYIAGELVERTHDWFAQDDKGNVWYFGERSREIEDGKIVSFEGSWEHGVNGAKAGIIMKANPQEGDAYFQENAPGVAVDQAEVITRDATVRTPFGRFANCLGTSEFTDLEPGVLEEKYYADGIGLVKSQAITGEREILRLVSFTR